MSGLERLPATAAEIPFDELDRDGAVAEAADRLERTDRRGLLAAGSAGVATMLVGGLARPRGARAAVAGADLDVLNYALTLEYLQAAFYTEAERMNSLQGKLREQARVVGSHERAHVQAFQALLGKQAIKQPKFDFHGVTEDPSKFRQTAVAFEDLAAAAYKEEAPRLQNPEFLAAAIRVHSVEARHAAWIRRLAGALPAADAFDEPKPRDEVKRLVASTGFLVSDPVTRSSGRPNFTG